MKTWIGVIGGLAIICVSLWTGCESETTITEVVDAPKLYINEFMAQNDSTISDSSGNGGYPDWIEIHNAGNSVADLGGMYLTDNLSNPTQWCVPDGVTIPAGGYLIFWADNDTNQGNTHTNFKLSTEREEIGLFNTAENGYAVIDRATFGPQVSDVSYGRSPNGAAAWRTFTAPTPGQPNP